LLLAGCGVVSRASTVSQPGKLTDIEQELVKQKAISITMAMYSGCKDYIAQESVEKARIQVNSAIRRLNGRRLDKISIQGYGINDDNTFYIEIQVYEEPYDTALFHDMIFKKVDGKWMLNSFETDI
jgi:hypothetical protein